MNATHSILVILQEQGAKTAEELAAITGIDLPKVRTTLIHMRQYGYLNIRPTTYAVTQKGVRRVEAPPATEESKKRLNRKKARLAGISAQAAKEARQLESMVSRSIRSRPALERAWGARA